MCILSRKQMVNVVVSLPFLGTLANRKMKFPSDFGRSWIPSYKSAINCGCGFSQGWIKNTVVCIVGLMNWCCIILVMCELHLIFCTDYYLGTQHWQVCSSPWITDYINWQCSINELQWDVEDPLRIRCFIDHHYGVLVPLFHAILSACEEQLTTTVPLKAVSQLKNCHFVLSFQHYSHTGEMIQSLLQ